MAGALCRHNVRGIAGVKTVSDRFDAESSGWADVLVNLVFVDGAAANTAFELQVTQQLCGARACPDAHAA